MDYSRNTHVHDFFNFVFQNVVFPVINRPTRVTKSSAAIVDNTLTNTLIDSHIQSGIVKTDISDHFAGIFYLKPISNRQILKRPSLKEM